MKKIVSTVLFLALSLSLCGFTLFNRGPTEEELQNAQKQIDALYEEENLGYDFSYITYQNPNLRTKTVCLVDFDKGIATSVSTKGSRDHIPNRTYTYSMKSTTASGNLEDGWTLDGYKQYSIVRVFDEDCVNYMNGHNEKLRILPVESAIRLYLEPAIESMSSVKALEGLTISEKD